jgi:hypothetical protein
MKPVHLLHVVAALVVRSARTPALCRFVLSERGDEDELERLFDQGDVLFPFRLHHGAKEIFARNKVMDHVHHR